MKKSILAALAVLATASGAYADGFRCTSLESNLNVKIFNHLDPEYGTRIASVMVISDPTVGYGNHTIAVFRENDGLLYNEGSIYEANVDLRHRESDRGGEYIEGTRLMYIDTIRLDVGFNYKAPISHGDIAEGYLTITKRDGAVYDVAMSCERYLKN